MLSRKDLLTLIGIPALVIALLTPFTPWLDMTLAGWFYQGDGQFMQGPFLQFLYVYGVLPAWIVSLGSLTLYFVSFVWKRLKPLRPYTLMLVLTLAFGSLVIHAGLKDHWGRPRPRQVVEFGGQQQYRPYWKPNFSPPEPSKSFPSGHTMMGWYFLAFVLLGRQLRSKGLLIAGVLLTVVIGGLLSYMRMAMGGHFFTDILFSAFIMWLSAIGSYNLSYRIFKI